LFKLFKKIFVSGEAELFAKLSTHVGLSLKALKIVENMITESDSAGVETKVVDIIALEKNGDRIVSELSNMVSKGAVPIALIGDFEALMDRIDDILDLIYFMGMELGRARRAGISENPVVKEIYEDILKIIRLAEKSLERLKNQFDIVLENFNKLRELDAQIDFYEDKVDEFKNTILDKIYSLGNQVDPITFNHLLELVRTSDTVVDACEDVSHSLLRIVSSLAY
jgi:predicted phosphate transport protein (TIGR00153 family)